MFGYPRPGVHKASIFCTKWYSLGLNSSCELFDTDLFRRRIEAAYEQMWQCWMAGEAPQAFAVKAD